MFGLTLREKIVKNIKLTCKNKIDVFMRYAIAAFEDDAASEYTDEIILDIISGCKRIYFEACFEELKQVFHGVSLEVKHRANSAFLDPQICGLPTRITTDYFYEKGVSANMAYAIFYYALTGKPMHSKKDWKNYIALAKFQEDLIYLSLSIMQK